MIKEDDREVLSYMVFQLFAVAQQILALATVALLLNAIPQTIAFTLFFAVLKCYAGGAHANKHWPCLTIFTGLAVAVCLLCKLTAFPPYTVIAASAVTLVLVLLRAPIIHPNNPKPPRIRKQMRKISIAIAAVQLTLIVVVSILWSVVALPAALGGLLAAVALVLPMPTTESEA
jgi:accessory gene regulator protein AgrB